MTKRTHIIKDLRESGAMSALVSVHAAIDDNTFLTKSGDLLVALRVEGPDCECWDAADIDRLARRFQSAVTLLDDGCRVYQYLMKRENVRIPTSRYSNPLVREAVDSRLEYLKAKAQALYSLENYFVISYEGWKPEERNGLARFLNAPLATVRDALSASHTVQHMMHDVEQARETLHSNVKNFITTLPDEIHATSLDKQQAFSFMRGLVNYAPHKLEDVRLKYDRFLDYEVCDSALECYPDHLRLDNFYVRVLTLKEPPAQTFAYVFRDLEKIPCNFIVVSEWKREANAKIRRLIQRHRRHFHNLKVSFANYLTTSSNSPETRNVLVDDSAAAVVDELGACLKEVELEGRAFGQFSLTIILYHLDDTVVRRGVAECHKVFATHGAQLIDERYNLLNAWRAMLPGNCAYNLRLFWLLDSHYADVSFLTTPNTGNREDAHLRAEYLAVFEAEVGLYFFSLHYLDLAHALIVGMTGAGKSFLVNFLLLYLQKYQPLTYIFDLGGSYESLSRLFGGAYLPIGIEKSAVTMNPFSLPPTPENLHFMFQLLTLLIESGNFRMTTEDQRELYTQLENLYAIGPNHRRLSTLANILPHRLRIQLYNWVDDGPYAAVFDNIEDNLTFAPFQTFDFAQMQKCPQALEAQLFYILHRATAAICNSETITTFKILAMDEAWRFLRHPIIRNYVVEGLKTWRKHNAALILSTQSSHDLVQSEILPIIVESCPTKIFLANPDMDCETYRDVFHLNEREADLIVRLIPKQQMLINRPDGSKVVNLNVSDKEYWIFTSNPHDRARRNEAFAQHGFKQGLEILARSKR